MNKVTAHSLVIGTSQAKLESALTKEKENILCTNEFETKWNRQVR